MTDIRILIPLAQGVEEMEAVIITNVLRRAGATVALRGLDEALVRASYDVLLGHEGVLSGEENADAIVLPGGAEGARRLAEDQRVIGLLRRFEEEDRWIAAICAAPTVLAAAGVCRGKRMTSHPSVRDGVEPYAGSYEEVPVCVDPKLVTGQGPGVTFEFALELVSLLVSPDTAAEVRAPMRFAP
jgi:DJ-1 family protein